MDQELTRRGFFVRLGRAAGLAALGAIVARLSGRSPEAATSRHGPQLCRRCPVLAGCSYPEADRTRRNLGAGEADKGNLFRDRAASSDVRGLCGARPTDASSSRCIGRKVT